MFEISHFIFFDYLAVFLNYLEILMFFLAVTTNNSSTIIIYFFENILVSLFFSSIVFIRPDAFLVVKK
jgi:hypothetical protein